MAHAVTVRSDAPPRPRVAAPALPMALLEGLLLFALVVLTPLLYLPLAMHNLPVASHVDERNALEVLQRFHHGSLNPGFFAYPTLYFYLVYALLLPVSYSNAHALIAGRLFDFALLGLTAFLVYLFCRDRLHSRAAGLVGAVFVLGSTVLSEVAGYLHPDVLMTAAGMASLYYLVGYFEQRTLRTWLPGLAFMGVAIGCKYTAFLLYIAYFATEALYSFHDRNKQPGARNSGACNSGARNSGDRLPRSLCIGILLAACVLLLLSSLFFPVKHLLAIIASTRSNVEVRPGNYYLDFFHHIRRTLAELGILCAVLALLCRVWRGFYEAISIKRLYYGLGIVLLVSLLCTPFSVVHPKQFFFDLGALARSNLVVAQGHAQWLTYASWLMQREGAWTVLMGAIGIAMLTATGNPRLRVVAVYLAIYLFVLGSSQQGYFRYLAPVVPLLYCGAGWLVVRLWNYRLAETNTAWRPARALAVLLLAGASLQMTFKVAQSRRLAHATNAFFSSYAAAKEATTGTAHYAGYAPSIELEEAGVRTRQVGWTSLRGTPLGQNLPCGDTLILDTPQAAVNGIDATRDLSVTVLLDAPGPGDEAQQVLRKSGCP